MGFKKRISVPDRADKNYYSNTNIFFKAGYGLPNCTAYAYGRMLENGADYTKLTGNAGDWFKQARNAGYPTGSRPMDGAIACWDDHIAVVEDASRDEISDSAYGTYIFRYYAVDRNYTRAGHKFYGFIYLPIYTPIPDPTPTTGDSVKLKKGAKFYDGTEPKSFVYDRIHKIKSISKDRAVITYNNVVVGAVKLADLIKA